MEDRDLLLSLGFSHEHIDFIEQLDCPSSFGEDVVDTVGTTSSVDLTNVIVDRWSINVSTRPIVEL